MLHKPQVFYLNKGFPILLLVLTSLNFISSPLHLFQLDLTIYTKMRTFAFNANLSQTSSFGNQNNLHGASFSSYLNHTEENFLRKLTGSTQSRSSIISATEEKLHAGKTNVQNEEIDVFDAEKYFKGTIDQENPRISIMGNTKQEHEKYASVNKSPNKPKTQPVTPSVQSDPSWNSQSVLLYSSGRIQKQRNPKTSTGKNLLAKFGCRCYCKDKKSVEVDTQNNDVKSDGVREERILTQPIKTGDVVQPNIFFSKTLAEQELNTHSKNIHMTGIESKRDDYFSFPVLQDASVTVMLNGDDETTRDSLEVFGSPILGKGNKPFSLETMLNWDPTHSPRVEGTETNDDMASETSSDLFEIESFSTNRYAYAPSEASIEWSVVTASATDFSMKSDSEESIAESRNKVPRNKGKEIQKQHCRPGILLGCNCKSQKSVRVAEDKLIKDVTSRGPHWSHKLDSSNSDTKENRHVRGFGSHTHSQPRSAHGSHFLDFQ